MCRQTLSSLDGQQCHAHRLHPRRVVRRAKKLKQAPLKARALSLGQHGQFGLAHWLRIAILGRTRGQIREKQVAFGKIQGIPRLVQTFIDRVEPERHIRLAIKQAGEIFGKRSNGLVNDFDIGGGGRDFLLLQSGHQVFDFTANARSPFQADHQDGAIHLMQVSQAIAQRGKIAGVAKESRQVLPGLIQRLVDFAFDPGQWADVQLDGHAIRLP